MFEGFTGPPALRPRLSLLVLPMWRTQRKRHPMLGILIHSSLHIERFQLNSIGSAIGSHVMQSPALQPIIGHSIASPVLKKQHSRIRARSGSGGARRGSSLIRARLRIRSRALPSVSLRRHVVRHIAGEIRITSSLIIAISGIEIAIPTRVVTKPESISIPVIKPSSEAIVKEKAREESKGEKSAEKCRAPRAKDPGRPRSGRRRRNRSPTQDHRIRVWRYTAPRFKSSARTNRSTRCGLVAGQQIRRQKVGALLARHSARGSLFPQISALAKIFRRLRANAISVA